MEETVDLEPTIEHLIKALNYMALAKEKVDESAMYLFVRWPTNELNRETLRTLVEAMLTTARDLVTALEHELEESTPPSK